MIHCWVLSEDAILFYFVGFCPGLVPVDFTQIIQGQYTHTEQLNSLWP